MAQTSKINGGNISPELDSSLDVLGASKELLIYHLSELGADLSSIEGAEWAIKQLRGEGAQIILAIAKGQLIK